jgi:hypothetical protein
MLNFLKNIALRAAFLAAGDENQENKAIAMNYIITILLKRFLWNISSKTKFS